MVSMGFAEILILAVFSGGATSAELAALIQPQHYFQSRQIEVSIDKMVDLAQEDPKDAKTQIMQLTALRYLADESDKLKSSPKYAAHRQALESIAQGKKAQDSLGFAQDYAMRVILKLDNKKPDAVKMRPLREDALSWFPADAQMGGALDFQPSQGQKNDAIKEILKLMPDQAKKEMYAHLELSGNIRLDRMAFAVVENATERNRQKIIMRYTGKVNRLWAAEALKKLNPRFELTHGKDTKLTPITLVQEPNRGPMIAIIDQTEVLLLAFPNDKEKHDELLNEVLAIRGKKKPNVTTGTLKERLAKIPDKAVGFFVSEGSEDLKRSLGFVLQPAPNKLAAFIERTPQGLDVQVQTAMANEEDANKLVQKIAGLRKEGIAALQQAMQQPLPAGLPPIPFQAMINVVESVQVQSQGDKVQSRAVVPEALLQQLPVLGSTFFSVHGPGQPAPRAVEVKME